mmetsp:Transcript_64792/g.190064  ORF Transcript_64792/g.190064 Transcript_64792/m.190064 type:complete len:353 (-) Transcript_64792:19-1077(-)
MPALLGLAQRLEGGHVLEALLLEGPRDAVHRHVEDLHLALRRRRGVAHGERGLLQAAHERGILRLLPGGRGRELPELLDLGGEHVPGVLDRLDGVRDLAGHADPLAAAAADALPLGLHRADAQLRPGLRHDDGLRGRLLRRRHRRGGLGGDGLSLLQALGCLVAAVAAHVHLEEAHLLLAAAHLLLVALAGEVAHALATEGLRVEEGLAVALASLQAEELRRLILPAEVEAELRLHRERHEAARGQAVAGVLLEVAAVHRRGDVDLAGDARVAVGVDVADALPVRVRRQQAELARRLAGVALGCLGGGRRPRAEAGAGRQARGPEQREEQGPAPPHGGHHGGNQLRLGPCGS